MVDPIRVPLVEDVEPRLSSSNKDGLASNVFYDKSKAENIYATKRPGITNYVTGSGEASGIFGYGDDLFIFSDPSLQQNWNGLTYGAGRWVAVASITDGVDTNLAIFSTNNGTSWRKATLPATRTWAYCAYGNGIFVAGANDATDQYATSTNGLTWAARTLPASVTCSGISFANGVFFLLAGPSTLYTSTDGLNWTSRAISNCGFGAGAGNWGQVTWNGTVYCATGDATSTNQKYSTSSDAITWTARTGASTQASTRIAANTSTGRLVSTGTTRNEYSTDNGVTWTQNTPGFTFQEALTFDGTNFVSVSSTKVIRYSTDGITWSTGSALSSTPLRWGNILFANSRYMVLSGGSTADYAGDNMYATGSTVTTISSDFLDSQQFPTIVTV